jgi:acetyl-CoA synthetase
MSGSDYIWQPGEDYSHCRVADFMHIHNISNWQSLVEKSSKDIEWFWHAFSQYAGMQWHKNYETLLTVLPDRFGKEAKDFAWTKWFSGGEINIAYNCLDWQMQSGRRAGARLSVGQDHPAIIWESESGNARQLSYGELNELAGKMARVLSDLNVKAGEAVGIYMPMVPEVVAVVFACLKIGAVAVPVFSGFGSQALVSRLADSKAKVLFTADGSRRRGKVIEIKNDVDEAAKQLPDLNDVLVLKHLDNKIAWHPKRDKWLDEQLARVDPLQTHLDLPAEHPSLYMYTSGTTARPKGTVHTHAGVLFQTAKELGFAFDVQASDKFFWLTDIGWMMGPWEMIGVTFWGGTMVIYEGAPNYPNSSRLWQLLEKYRVSTFGISPTIIRLLKANADSKPESSDLSSLRLLGSTGEAWDPDSYQWFFERVGGRRCPIINISGGTEIMGCLLMPLPIMPLKSCSLGAAALGMDVDVYDEEGESIVDSIGHLVCIKPAPSMTKGFLNDAARYEETYFQRFPGVWYHGDWAKKDKDGAWFLFGRSDETIKVAGKRIGPAEIESILIEHAHVAEAAIIGVPHEIKGEALVCFVVPIPTFDKTGTAQLALELKELIRKSLGAVNKPEEVHIVSALPKTRSGKIVRGAIRRKYLGQPLGDISSIENPDSLASLE